METPAKNTKGHLVRCPDEKIRLRVNDINYDIVLQNIEVEIKGEAAFFEENDRHFIDYPSSYAKEKLLRYQKVVGQVRRGLTHLAVFHPSDVLPFRTEKLTKRKYLSADGHPFMVNMDSQRYFVFAKSLCCVDCGLVGEAMILDGQKDNHAHFNLYGFDSDKALILLTKDHLKPKALGGKDVLSNYVTMCEKCNGKKGHQYIGLISDHLRDWAID